MATHLSVPSDVEPTSMVDLVNDCRELVGAVASLGATAVTTGIRRLPHARSGARPVEIASGTAASLDGYAEYGS